MGDGEDSAASKCLLEQNHEKVESYFLQLDRLVIDSSEVLLWSIYVVRLRY